MTGLILKDILVMRKTLKTYLLFLVFYAAMALFGVFSLNFVVAFIQVIVMMLPISAFAYDERAKWDRYAMALPLGRRTVVAARYSFVLLMLLISAVVGLSVGIALSFSDPGSSMVEYLGTVLVSLGVGLLIADIILPLNYKLGPERARPYLYAVFFLPAIAAFGAAKLGMLDGLRNFSALDQMPDASVLGLFSLVPVAALAGLGVSYLISCRIVERKEF
ncbi:MAG: ABC-2 transporter permease [Lawsonibacter sp.]|nr:ABC-2 transporter permease [Lawsonibacter sp.]